MKTVVVAVDFLVEVDDGVGQVDPGFRRRAPSGPGSHGRRARPVAGLSKMEA
jgi:hypothetical protein